MSTQQSLKNRQLKETTIWGWEYQGSRCAQQADQTALCVRAGGPPRSQVNPQMLL